MKKQVENVLEQIRPTLQKDGGDVELVDVTEQGVVKVRLTGNCQGCPVSHVTLNEGIEKLLKNEIPQVTKVEAVK